MNIKLLSLNMYYKSFNIFENELIKPFSNYYVNNEKTHKYKLFNNYVFRTDLLKLRVKEFIQSDNSDNSYLNMNLKKEKISNYLINDELNFKDNDIIKYSKITTHLNIGEFYSKKNGICNLFLSLNEENEIYGYCIDNNTKDCYFTEYKNISEFEKDETIFYKENSMISEIKSLANKEERI